jgi:hypothetical protein
MGTKLTLEDCHNPRYIIRIEYATVSQDLIKITITKIQL